jgi:site-specific DNA recombinase
MKLKTSTKAKQFVALARVSSRAQEVEGTSLEVQEAALRLFAAGQGGEIARLWKITETASKAERRVSFNEMLKYAKANADNLDGILVYKVDRAARNMSDYGKLLELEIGHRVPLIAVSQPTQDTPAGRMARNVMATMGTFFAEQLSVDVKQGLAQRVRDGMFPTVPPYGYATDRSGGRSVVRIHPEHAENVKRIFQLYAFGHCTLDMIVERMTVEGRVYKVKQPHWVRSKIHRILRDRAYIGDLKFHAEWRPGQHEPLIDRDVFERVQTLLGGKVYKANEVLYGGELMTCGHCGRPITGEVVRKPSGKSYVYYRCARYTAADHPRIRLRESEVDGHVLGLFERIRQPESIQRVFRKALAAWSSKHHSQARSRASELQGQLDDVRRQQERLLNLHLAGTIEDQAFASKNVELRDRVAKLTLQLEATDRKKDENVDLALRVFELSQRLREKWLTADFAVKRRLLNLICLNLVLKGASLVIACRKPFNSLVEGLSVSDSGEGGIRTLARGLTP